MAIWPRIHCFNMLNEKKIPNDILHISQSDTQGNALSYIVLQSLYLLLDLDEPHCSDARRPLHSESA